MKSKTEEFIEKSTLLHSSKYDYAKTKYGKDRNDKVIITCNIHGDFTQTPFGHLLGRGCNKCAIEYRAKSITKTQEQFLTDAHNIHRELYTYNNTVYVGDNKNIIITCREHGDFPQKATNHLQGKGCPICADKKWSKNKTKTTEQFIKEAIDIHGELYLYNNSNYVLGHEDIIITCRKHGDFPQSPNNHLQGKGCPKCIGIISKPEKEITDFLNIYTTTVNNSRKMLDGLEVDILIPENKLGIEYDGLYWHSNKFTESNSHINKTILARKKDIELIHIFDDDWRYKKDIVKSRLLNLIGKTHTKIYARNTIIKEVSSKECSKFLENNHLQGKIGAKVKLGLYYKDELISLMTFGGLRKNLGSTSKEGSYELLRFCNKLNTNVVGGASKLLKHFEKTYNPKQLISYADRNWSNGDLYEKLGFTFYHLSKPNYYYIVKNKRENRFKYRKDILVKEGFDKNKTEKEIMQERGYLRIYDCGSLKYIKNYS